MFFFEKHGYLSFFDHPQTLSGVDKIIQLFISTIKNPYSLMRNLLVFFLYFLSSLSFIQCSKTDNSEGLVNLKKIDIEVIDTIKVKNNSQELLLSDFKNSKLVFFDFFSKEILITDLKGNILSKFNNSLLGMDDFGDVILGVCFQSDTSISVLSDEAYFIYTFEGKTISKYKHPFSVDKQYLTGDFKLSYDVKRKMFASLLTTSTDLPAKVPEFYSEIKHITTFKVDSKKYDWEIKYEPESSYLQKEYFTSDWSAHFDLDRDTIALIYGRDPIVYIYGLSDFKKLASFKTYPEHFKQVVKFKFSENTSNNHKLRLTAFANSSYRKIFAQRDTVITSYTTGVPLEAFDHIENVNDYNIIAYKNQQYYLQVFVNGRKESSDYELPKEFPGLELLSNDLIFLGEQPLWENKNDGYTRFLIAKMKFK